MTWHRIDDPENPPPKDGTRLLAITRGGFRTIVRWVPKFAPIYITHSHGAGWYDESRNKPHPDIEWWMSLNAIAPPPQTEDGR